MKTKIDINKLKNLPTMEDMFENNSVQNNF